MVMYDELPNTDPQAGHSFEGIGARQHAALQARQQSRTPRWYRRCRANYAADQRGFPTAIAQTWTATASLSHATTAR